MLRLFSITELSGLRGLRLGDGNTVSVWDDNWVEPSPMRLQGSMVRGALGERIY